MSETFKRTPTRMVPAPSHGIMPERDVGSRPVLETRNLGISFGGLQAVDDFNLIIGKTEIAGLIGPNGAGKSTILKTLAGHLPPPGGVKAMHCPLRRGAFRCVRSCKVYRRLCRR